MYKVVKHFTDLLDNNRAYGVGDIFPHADAGYEVSEERFAELAGKENKRGEPLIAKVKKPAAKKVKKETEEEE